MNKIDCEKVLILISIGLAVALQNKKISFDEAEKVLFSPYAVDFLKKANFDKNLIKLIHDAMELEDVADLIPDKLDSQLICFADQALDLLSRKEESKQVIPLFDKIIDCSL
jgi:hypothetical protein